MGSGRADEPSARGGSAPRAKQRITPAGTSGRGMPSVPPIGEDIEALVELTLMDCVRSADADLRDILAEMRATARVKAQIRAFIARISRDLVALSSSELQADSPAFAPDGLGGEAAYHAVPWPVPEPTGGVRFVPTDLFRGPVDSSQSLRAILDDLKGRLDSMNEMSEMASLRLQMAMDRRSKLIEALSNIMKKIDDTSGQIVKNMK
jgi:hypothetical protein